jgi:hypothetical protein
MVNKKTLSFITIATDDFFELENLYQQLESIDRSTVIMEWIVVLKIKHKDVTKYNNIHIPIRPWFEQTVTIPYLNMVYSNTSDGKEFVTYPNNIIYLKCGSVLDDVLRNIKS